MTDDPTNEPGKRMRTILTDQGMDETISRLPRSRQP